MSDSTTTRPTTRLKMKNSNASNVNDGRTSDPDTDEVSSTSLDKRDEMTNGSNDAIHEIHNDVDSTADAGDYCEITNIIEEPVLEQFNIPDRTLPAYNAPEKIIIVYDSAIDEISTGFVINNETICPATMLKRSLRFFLYNKHLIDPRHEYALAVINANGMMWVKSFTSNVETIISALDNIEPCETEDILVLDHLFKLISDNVKLPDVKENFNVPPPYVVRVLFTYGRSFTMPRVIEKNAEFLSLVNSPYFTFDILMTHEMPSATNNCIKIFKDLQLIDNKGFAYFFPVGRSAAQLHLCVAKLLGHPLQRAFQRNADYRINIMET